jgi:hypothetical protein
LLQCLRCCLPQPVSVRAQKRALTGASPPPVVLVQWSLVQQNHQCASLLPAWEAAPHCSGVTLNKGSKRRRFRRRPTWRMLTESITSRCTTDLRGARRSKG